MEKILSEKDAYFKGIEFWNNNDYRNARYYFEMAYKYNGELNDLSLSKLIQIDLREGKYAKVRNLLKNNQSDIIIMFKSGKYNWINSLSEEELTDK